MDFKIDSSMKSPEPTNRETLVKDIHILIRDLNNGYQFEKECAEEWADYLLLFLDGYKDNLSNPYSDIKNYSVKSFSQSTPGLENIDSLFMLNELPASFQSHASHSDSKLNKSLFITALGGIDSTFYKSLSKNEAFLFVNKFYAPDLVEAFQKYEAVHLIPRGFVAKQTRDGRSVTNTESMILHAYAAGIRNIAVIANAMTYRAIEEYLDQKFRNLKDLNIIVTAQPLLPRIKSEHDDSSIHISKENGAYPGGHGHGFKYCLTDERVKTCVERNRLRYFIFTNGDNAAVLNWGGDHFETVLQQLETLKQKPDYKNLRIGFFLVWEYLRKGGFSFLLEDKNSKKVMPQIFEAELAEKSGANIQKLEKSRGGYNTNVAVGIIKDVYSHLHHLPMALKTKSVNGTTYYSFEASLATAMTTYHTKDGRSKFDKNTAVNILGPKSAVHQHWNHIALRKRSDLFAFYSSLFKVKSIETDYGSFPCILTDRDATQKHPELAGNFIDPTILNIKDFFDIFVDAELNVDDFYGTLKIDLLETNDLPRGQIKFEKSITFAGLNDSLLECSVPAGKKWIIRDKIFNINKKRTITKDDAIVLTWNSQKSQYL